MASRTATVSAADGEALARTAHRLKGSVLTFSAGPAAAAALELEQIGREGDLARAPMALARLTASIVALRGSLASLVDERKTA